MFAGCRSVLGLFVAIGLPEGLIAQDATTLAEPDRTLPAENQAWVDNARTTGFAISSLTSSDFSDLEFLRGLIGDRRLIQLGESAHGVAEFNTAKIRLIRFLHEEMGFDVIAFESSLFECYRADQLPDDVTADRLMRSCVFGVWYTAETLPLFEYILSTRSTDRPLTLAGFDTQSSSPSTAAQRPGFWRSLLSRIDPTYADAIAAMDSTFLALRFRADELAVRADSLIASYDALSRYLDDRGSDLVSAGAAPNDVHVAARLSYSTVRYVQQLNASGSAGTFVRDEGMADNLAWLMERFYPDKKIITWGHNFHLRHDNESVSPDPLKTMGQWVAERHRDQMYTVGLYMRWGRGAMPNREVFNVVPPSSGSLESILGHVGEPYFFIDLRRTGAAPAGEWVRTPIVTKTWGQADVTMTLSDQYDAVLFIDRVHPPQYR